MATIQIIDTIDNTGSLYEEVLVDEYGEDAGEMVANTKFLRAYILQMIKDFVASEEVASIKEFSTEPIMVYATDPEFYYDGIENLTTDLIIVNKAFSKDIIQNVLDTQPIPYPLVVEVLETDTMSIVTWDQYLDDLIESFDLDEVRKVIIEDGVSILHKWSDALADTKEYIKAYNAVFDIGWDKYTFYEEPLSLISTKYWENLSFILTINDYDIYSEDPDTMHYLDVIAEKYYNNGYFDEIVIKMNYFYWHDNYEKIITWSQEKLKSALVSYRFDTIFSNTTKHRYFNAEEAAKYGDVQRKNTVVEEVEMFEQQMPIFLEGILTNPQTYGFELVGGYFGNEGYVPNVVPNTPEFDEYKYATCKTLAINPFAKFNDNVARIFRDPNDVKLTFFCMKTDELQG